MKAASVALLLALVLVPAGRISAISIGGRTPDLFYVDLALIPIIVMRGMLVVDLVRLWSRGWRWLLGFVAVVLLGGLLSSDRTAYLGALRPVLYAVAVAALAHDALGSERVLRTVLAVMVLALSVIAAQVAAISGGDLMAGAVEKADVDLDWGRSNYLATFGLVGAFVGLGMSRGASRLGGRILGAVGFFAAAVLLIGSQSRAAMLAFVVALLIVGPLLSRLRGPRGGSMGRWVAGAVIVLAMSALAYGAYVGLLDIVGIDVDAFLDSGNIRRIDAWLSAAESIREHPLVGIGWYNATVLVDEITDTGTTTHSLPLQLLAETGAVGFGCLALTIARALRAQGPRPAIAIDRRLRDGLRLAVCAVLLQCLVEPSFWGVQFVVVFWTLLAALYRTKERATALRRPHAPALTPVVVEGSTPVVRGSA